jgi:hypothetical protein
MTSKKVAPDSTTRTKRGRWKKGESGNPSGRPVQNPVRRLLMENAEELTQKAIGMALGGDTTALTACLNRIAPTLKPEGALIQLELPQGNDIVLQGSRIIKAATSGEITPDTAAQLLQALGTLARIEEVKELRDRLEALEMSLKGKKP